MILSNNLKPGYLNCLITCLAAIAIVCLFGGITYGAEMDFVPDSEYSVYVGSTDSEMDLEDSLGGQNWLDYFGDDMDFELYSAVMDYYIGTPSTATPSIALPRSGIVPYGNWDGWNGMLPTVYVDIFRDIVSKLPNGNSYVFFRSAENEYRLIYCKDLVISADGFYFTGTDASFVRYRLGTDNAWWVEFGQEGSFRLGTHGNLVYSDIGLFPSLDSGVNRSDFRALLFAVVLFLLFVIYRSFFSTGKFYI